MTHVEVFQKTYILHFISFFFYFFTWTLIQHVFIVYTYEKYYIKLFHWSILGFGFHTTVYIPIRAPCKAFDPEQSLDSVRGTQPSWVLALSVKLSMYHVSVSQDTLCILIPPIVSKLRETVFFIPASCTTELV